jgi:hypothetical protein
VDVGHTAAKLHFMNHVYALIYATFVTLGFVAIAGGWVKGIADILKARRLGEVRTGSSVGRTVYRSNDPKKFRNVLRWRTTWLAIMPIGLMWFALLTLAAILGVAA